MVVGMLSSRENMLNILSCTIKTGFEGKNRELTADSWSAHESQALKSPINMLTCLRPKPSENPTSLRFRVMG